MSKIDTFLIVFVLVSTNETIFTQLMLFLSILML